LLVLADRYIIEFTRTTAEVGMYSVAYGLGEKIMQLITLPLIIAMGPVMIQTFERQGQALAQRVQTQMTRYFALLTFPLLFGLAATSRHFMQVFTGPDYRAAFPILAIVAAGSLSYGLVQIAGNGIALHKKSTITMTNTMTAGVFNIVTNIVFVPRFGYMAAAYTTLASYALLLALTWYRSRPYMEWVIPWADLARIAAVCGAMWAAIALTLGRVPGNIGVLLAEVALGAAVYIAGLFVTGAVRADERVYVRDLAARVWRRLSGRAR
jgi:O-antigen/teichoic acid export membrane protein